MADSSIKAYGIIAEFEAPAVVMQAAEKVREAGFTRITPHTEAFGYTAQRP